MGKCTKSAGDQISPPPHCVCMYIYIYIYIYIYSMYFLILFCIIDYCPRQLMSTVDLFIRSFVQFHCFAIFCYIILILKPRGRFLHLLTSVWYKEPEARSFGPTAALSAGHHLHTVCGVEHLQHHHGLCGDAVNLKHTFSHRLYIYITCRT